MVYEPRHADRLKDPRPLYRIPGNASSQYAELLEVAKAMRDYIDALPADTVAKLPVMPGFDRDWAEQVISGNYPAE